MPDILHFLGLMALLVAWLKRDQEWARALFWVGLVLVAVPIAWEFGAGFRHGLTEAATVG